jgi:hypothetical protein
LEIPVTFAFRAKDEIPQDGGNRFLRNVCNIIKIHDVVSQKTVTFADYFSILKALR